MKKSKFLKKSLSLLLVVLLAVAMVPFGASAADANPKLAELRVGLEGALATIDHNTKRIDVVVNPSNSLSNMGMSYVAENGLGTLYYGSALSPVTTSGMNLSAYKDETNNAVVPLRLVDPDNAAFFTDYILTIQNQELSNNVLISEFDIPGKHSSTFEVGKTTFDVLMPYNADLSAAAVANWNIGVKLADPQSNYEILNLGTLDFEPGAGNTGDYDQFFTIEVTAPNNEMQSYRVNVRRAEGITDFSIANGLKTEIYWPDQISTMSYTASELVANGSSWGNGNPATANQDGLIYIEIPKHAYTTNNDCLKNVIPEFTSEIESTRVRYIDSVNGNTTLVSGTTKVDLTEAYMTTWDENTSPRVYIEASYPAGGPKAVYGLVIVEEGQGSRATIEGVTVSSPAVPNYQVAGVVDGSEINVTVANNLDLSKLLLNITVPEGAEFDFRVGDTNYTSTSYPSTQNPATSTEYVNLWARRVGATTNPAEIDLRNKVTITVKSETGVTKTYTLNVTTASTPDVKAKFNSMSLKNNTTGETYTADPELLKGVEIVFTVPSSLRPADLQDFTLYYSAPLGVSLEYNNGSNDVVLPVSSTKLTAAHIGTVVPSPNYLTPAAQTNIRVTSYNSLTNAVDTTNYNVKFKYEDFKTGGTFKKFTMTSASTPSEVNSDNTYNSAFSTVVKQDKSTATPPTVMPFADQPAGTSISVLTVTVPYMMYNKLAFLTNEPLSDTYIADMEIPERSGVYVQFDRRNAGGTLDTTAKRVYPIADGKWDFSDVIYNILDEAENDAHMSGIRIFVLSEKAIYDYDTNGTATVSALMADTSSNVAKHILVVEPAAPRATANLTSLKLVNEKGQKVDAVISGTTITANIPYSWANNTEEIHFEYEAAPGNLLAARNTDGTAPFIYSGGWYQPNGTPYSPSNGHTIFKFDPHSEIVTVEHISGPSTLRSLIVESETGSMKEYKFTYNVNPIETGAAFESFSINGVPGTISGNTINVILPYASKFDKVAPVFTTSKMATVTYGTSTQEVISGETEIDFTGNVVLKVTSEDGNYVNNYTVNVTAPMNFSDVPSDQWYYKWVMEAAQLGIISGYGDGTFRPQNPVTRGEFVKMLTVAYGVSDAELDSYTNNPFLDVDIDRFYGKPIAWAVDNGFISGYTDSTFKPDANITREEMASIFARVKGLTLVTDPTDKYTDDASISKWAYGYVYAVQADGAMTGNKDGSFAPGKTATRAETASAVVRYYHNK